MNRHVQANVSVIKIRLINSPFNTYVRIKYSINELTGLSERHFVWSSSISRLSHPFWAFLRYFCAALSCTFDFWAEASLHARQRVPRRVMSSPCCTVPVRLGCRCAKTLTARVRSVMFFCHMVAVWLHIFVTQTHSWWIPCQGFGTADNGGESAPNSLPMQPWQNVWDFIGASEDGAEMRRFINWQHWSQIQQEVLRFTGPELFCLYT